LTLKFHSGILLGKIRVNKLPSASGSGEKKGGMKMKIESNKWYYFGPFGFYKTEKFGKNGPYQWAFHIKNVVFTIKHRDRFLPVNSWFIGIK